MNVGKSKVMSCSRYGNGVQMYMRLIANRLRKWIVLSTCIESQEAADGGCERDVVHRMNEGYRA